MINIKNFPEDFEREYLKDVVYLQADKARTEEEIMQEIIEEENRLPAKITIVTSLPEPQKNELESNSLPF
jgi:hypothetical protein